MNAVPMIQRCGAHQHAIDADDAVWWIWWTERVERLGTVYLRREVPLLSVKLG